MFTAVSYEMRYFLLMVLIFVVSNGFALDLLYPNHLHCDTAAEKAELTMWIELTKISLSDFKNR